MRTELETDDAELSAEMKTELGHEIGGLRRSMTNWMVTLLGAMASIGFIS